MFILSDYKINKSKKTQFSCSIYRKLNLYKKLLPFLKILYKYHTYQKNKYEKNPIPLSVCYFEFFLSSL